MRFLYIWLVLGLAQGYTIAQTLTLRGKITQADQQPVMWANVQIDGIKGGVVSDTTGNFMWQGLPIGTYILRISAVGFKPYQQQLHLTSDMHPLNILLESDEHLLEEIVVSGNLTNTSRSASPVAITLISPRLLQRSMSPCLFESLSLVNGLMPLTTCNVCQTGELRINGMPGAYTMVTIDGMPIVSSLGTVYGLMGIPNSMIERVEVVKGAASTLYGSEAVAGLVNIITKDATRAPRLAAELWGSSYGETNLDLGTRLKVSPRISGIISTNYYRFREVWDKNQDGFTDISPTERISVFNKWQATRAQGRIAQVSARYYYEDRWGGQTNWSPAERGGDRVYGESIYTRRLELLSAYQLPIAGERVMLNASYIDHDQNSVYGTTVYLGRQKIAFAQLTWHKSLTPRLELLTGTALRYTHYDDNTPATAVAERVYLPAVFTQATWQAHSNHQILSGVRLDKHRTHGAVITPRFAYKWAITPNNTLRINAGKGFRVVNLFTEDHAALTGARQVVVAETLRPEVSWNTNIQYERNGTTAGYTWTLNAAAFYTYFSNQILPDYDTDPDKIIYRNLTGYALSRGVSVNIDLDFDFGFEVQLGGTLAEVFQHNADIGTRSLIQAPPFVGNALLSYEIPQWKLRLDYTAQFTAPMRLPILPNDFRPSHSPWVGLHHLQITMPLKRVEAYLGIKNITNLLPQHPIMRPFDPFDRAVEVNNPQGYTFDPTYAYAPMWGRRVMFGLRYNLK